MPSELRGSAPSLQIIVVERETVHFHDSSKRKPKNIGSKKDNKEDSCKGQRRGSLAFFQTKMSMKQNKRKAEEKEEMGEDVLEEEVVYRQPQT